MNNTRILKVELGARSYPIRIGKGIAAGEAAFPEAQGRQLRVVTDSNVAPIHLDPLLAALHLGREQVFVLQAGETRKTWDSAGEVLDWLLASKLSRDGCLIALGGGVVGDLAGFCAAIYQRGIDFIQVPTTLLAQVDSSVGGKTGVNHARGKNLIGAFHQPLAVIADTNSLATLPKRELLSGLAEVIKYGMLADSLLFEWLENNLDRILALEPNALAEIIERCCAIKARIVGLDERETGGGPRALLNLGHTFGHAIETHTGYTQWLHGEAIATGLCLAAELSARHGWITDTVVARCVALIARAGLPTRPPAGMLPADFRNLMGLDKKVQNGKLRLILLRGLGDAILTSDFDAELLAETLSQACA
ncbi:MAG: 3-dehydroquinate synthase [Hydrocarboniphaga sp.]|uniref:3-dehydroquinate synthase n=1 Tax=Hydrocarboniphaga sp. TaxID=2033016 RepID=UPI002635962C|nr:3-dehydroquinate synthase [Hydrocarboniphaga sp.]MDB5971592.1 3-dehydroquinate synthase [Hydrocarboniphaga sp.]